MSSSSHFSSNSLLSGSYQGRVLEVICGDEKSNESTSEINNKIIVLIKDQLHTLSLQENVGIFQGALISFEVTETVEWKK